MAEFTERAPDSPRLPASHSSDNPGVAGIRSPRIRVRPDRSHRSSDGPAGRASLEQVRGLAGRLDGLERIDVLISNAGLVLGERRITPDGLEHVFALNHLAPFLLTSLLLPKLAASAPARVVTVTSGAHSAARLDLSDPNLERGWDSWRSYASSKLASILFTRELARRLDGTGVTANCAHPGVVRTGFGRESRGWSARVVARRRRRR